MKRFSLESELKAIFTLCHDGSSGGQQAASHLLSALNAKHFVTEQGESAYRRIRYLLKQRGELPEIEDIFEDPGLEKDIRRSLRHNYKEGIKGVSNVDRARKLFARLETFRKLRALFELGAELENNLSGDTVDPDKVIADMAVSLTNASTTERNMRVSSRGDGNSALDVAKQVLTGEGPQIIPTGFKAFDNINSGWTRGSVVLITTVTGGGKSTIGGQLVENIALNGGHVGLAPLEMSTEEMTMRDIARASNIDLVNLLSPKKKMTLEERREAYKLFKRRTEEIDKRGGSSKIVEPGGDIDIHSLLAEVAPFDFDVFVIDYLGILKGMSGDKQWQVMGEAVRYSKIWAHQRNAVVVILAQLSDDGELRYSKMMGEHAPYWWSWVPDDLFKETGVICVNQRKARMAKPFDFYLKIDSAHMQVRDLTKEELANYLDLVESRKKKKKNKSKDTDYSKDSSSEGDEGVDDDDEDDEDDAKEYNKKKKKISHGRGKWSPTYSGGSKNKKRRSMDEEF